ncbi:MAG: protein kinase, partial [Gemmatimonadota bacterium]
SAGGGNRMTETGMSLGTPHYMSPEQAMGEREITARSDVYALGAMTYEMLTGDPPFTGSTAQAIVAKVMTEKPASIRKNRDRVPESVEDAVLTALEKLPADRFATADEFARAMASPTTMSTSRRVVSRGTWLERRVKPVVTVLGLVTLAAIAFALRPASREPVVGVDRFALNLGQGEGLGLSWAPDGRAFVYAGAAAGGTSQLFVRSLDALAAKAVPGTEGATSPFFSPDGQQLAYITTTPFALKIIPRDGGQATTIVRDTISGGGGSWSPDGWIYFDGANSLSRIHPDGTGRELVMALDSTQKEIGLAWPEALPGGRGVICRIRRKGDDVGDYQIFVIDLKTRARKALFKAPFARYAPSGHLLYVLGDGSLMAVRFDLAKLEISGPPVLISAGLAVGAFGAADLAIAPDGTLLYSIAKGTTTSEPVWVERDGTESLVDSALHVVASSLALSPDGTRLALHLSAISGGPTSRTEDIWVKQLPTGPMSRLTAQGEQNRRPSWSHDGRDILFLSSRSGPSSLFRQRADGSSAAVRVTWNDSGRSIPIAEGVESPDGRWLVLATEQGTPGDGDILIKRIGVDSVPKPLIADPFQETGPAISPDGRWLAYSSTETGRAEIYVRPFPDVDAGKIQISNAGGISPHWSHRGDELFYRNNFDDMMVAALKTTPNLSVVGQKRLFNAVGYIRSAAHSNFDVSKDDRRLLMLRFGSVGSSDNAPQIILVQNFLGELRRLLP